MNSKRLFNALLALAAALLLSSCVGDLFQPKADPTEFYMMRAVSQTEKIDVPNRFVLNLLPITTPSYMSRNQIVTLAEDGTVKLSEFDRWAEPTQSGFTRVIVENLASSSDNIAVYAYPSVAPDAWNLRVFVYDCVGKIGGNLTFKGKWQIDSSVGKQHSAKDFAMTIPCGNTYASYVKAMNEAVSALSREIVKAVSEISNKKE